MIPRSGKRKRGDRRMVSTHKHPALALTLFPNPGPDRTLTLALYISPTPTLTLTLTKQLHDPIGAQIQPSRSCTVTPQPPQGQSVAGEVQYPSGTGQFRPGTRPCGVYPWMGRCRLTPLSAVPNKPRGQTTRTPTTCVVGRLTETASHGVTPGSISA